MTISFYNGISGLKSFQTGIDMWGDNIANINNYGFKERTPHFETLFSQNLVGSAFDDTGLGSTIATSELDLKQGNLVLTDNPFDIALEGEGWLKVQKNSKEYYTRNGAFYRDGMGNLVNQNGDFLMVASANNIIQGSDGNYTVNPSLKPDIFGTLSPITLPATLKYPKSLTSEVKLQANLKNDNDILLNPTPAIDEKIDFNSLYDQNGKPLNMVNGQNIVVGFGHETNYENSMLTTSFCIYNDETDEKDFNVNFQIDGKSIQIIMPDGTNKNEIIDKLKEEFNKNGIKYEISNNEIKVYAKDKLIITSNQSFLPTTAAEVLTYNTNPKEENEFSNIKEFNNKISDLSKATGGVDVGLYEGKITVANQTPNEINMYVKKANYTNKNFYEMLTPLSRTIFPNETNKSFMFTSNTQNFGGNIITANGKENLLLSFTKEKIENSNTKWLLNVYLNDEHNLIYQTDVTFDDSGKIVSNPSITFSQPQNITIDLSGLNGYDSSETSISNSFVFTQNGVEEGDLIKYEIDSYGNILGSFTNDKTVTLAQIPIFHFQNDQGLDSVGDNLFMETINSNKGFLYSKDGEYIPGATIVPSSLEQSNVQMSVAMTELIVTQKAFSASAKTVTTSDEMIQRAINLKR